MQLHSKLDQYFSYHETDFQQISSTVDLKKWKKWNQRIERMEKKSTGQTISSLKA